MGLENVPKYLVLSSLIWRLVRPFAAAVAKNTRNTTLDDDVISAVDIVLTAKPVEMENTVKGVQNAVQEARAGASESWPISEK